MTVQFLEKPTIRVTQTDANRLWMLASALGKQNEEADDLLAELERATVVPDADKVDFISIGGSAVFYTKTQGEKHVTLVLPKDANIALGRVSIMTPVGVALLGLSAGQSFQWKTRDGRMETLTILSVNPPPFDNTDDNGPSAA